MEFLRKLFDLFRHLNEDEKWRAMIDQIGGVPSLYGLLCLIVFCETGLVVTPFLPGDSLLFFVGAKSASNIGIDPFVVAPLIVLAALLGDNVNYWLGRRLGPAVFSRTSMTEPSFVPSLVSTSQPSRSFRVMARSRQASKRLFELPADWDGGPPRSSRLRTDR